MKHPLSPVARAALMVCAVAAAACPIAAHAQAYPTRTVTMVLPYAGGGSTDIEARLHGRMLTDMLGQPFVVENKPGGGTTLATGYVAKSAPDGYTLLIASGSHTIIPSLYNLGFDNVKDFAPLYLMGRYPTVLIVTPNFPARTLREYLAYAKANPGKINYATGGAGGVSHLVGARLHSESATTATFIHYKVFSALQGDLFAGRVDVTAYSMQAAIPQIQAGKVRPLAVTGDQRSKLLPAVQAVAEEPGLSDYYVGNWTGYLAPAGTPQPVLNRLSEAFARIAQSPEVKSNMEQVGGVAINGAPAQFRQFLVNETEQWRKLIQATGIKIEE